MPKIQINSVINQRYRVDSFIYVGNPVAYKVLDLTKQTYIEMKVLNLDFLDDPRAVKLFIREANAYKKFSHPNIVPFYGFEKTDDAVLMLQKFIDGGTVRELLKTKRPLPINDVLVIMKALCASLGYAHRFGVVHCDVKPGNILFDQGGAIYLTVLDIARYAFSTATIFNNAGTVAYMSPEQIRGNVVTSATDIYSLGITLFELLTGQRPFTGTPKNNQQKSGASNDEQIRNEHLNSIPPNPSAINNAINPQIAQVILRALEKKPEDRFQTTDELFHALCVACQVDKNNIPDHISLELLPNKTNTAAP